MYLLPLLAFGLLLNVNQLEARSSFHDPFGRDSIWSPFALLDDTAGFPEIMTRTNSSGINMYEDEEHIVVQASLPGLELDEIDITFERGSLGIRGEKKYEENNKERNYYHKCSNNYAYNIQIPRKIDESKDPIASYKNGLMTVVFDKAESSKPKKIKIQSK